MCRPESHIVPSTSSCCSITCLRDLRRACISVNSQRDGWGRFRACHREGGRSRKKQGPADGAPRRRARFGVAVRRVHRTTRRDRIGECVGTWRVLPRRKRRPLPRTPMHKGALRLPRRRPGLALPGVACSPAQGKTSVLGKLRRRGPHIKRVARRRKRPARGRAKRSASCGRLRGSAFVSSVQPSDGHSQRVGRKSSGPPSRRKRSQASKKRHRASICEPALTRSSSGRRKSDTPHCQEVHPDPCRRRSSSQRHDQGKSDCQLRRRFASVANERQSVRKELGSAASQRSTKLFTTVAARTMQQVMFLEAQKSKRSRMSSSASWVGRGASSDAESDLLGLVMEVSKQYPTELLKSFLRTKGVLAEVMVSLTDGHVGTRAILWPRGSDSNRREGLL